MLLKELLAQKGTISPYGKTALIRKDRIRQELGGSPDYSGCLAVTFEGQLTVGGSAGIYILNN